jgi:hypothetical protein
MVVGSICASLLVGTLAANAASLPPDANNAALLYYQAFLLCPDRDKILDEQDDPRGVYQHSASAEDIARYRKYAEDYRGVIQLVRAATDIQQCNWAIPDQQGHEVRANRWRAISSLNFLIGANVRVLASDGDYKTALSDSLMLRRFARHLAEDPNEESYSIPVAVERVSLFCVSRVLEVIPPDETILKWLREQLADKPPVSEPFSAKIKQDFEWQIGSLRTNKRVRLSELRQRLSEKAANSEQRKNILAFTDEEIIGLISKPYAEFLDSVVATLNKERPYEETYTEIERLTQEYSSQGKNNPAIILPLQFTADMWVRLYAVRATHLARFNALKAAVEVYLLKARTGQLPKTLPDGLPKDPLSRQDFEYKVTGEGFTLRSSSYKAKDIRQYGVPEYEFKVRK